MMGNGRGNLSGFCAAPKFEIIFYSREGYFEFLVCFCAALKLINIFRRRGGVFRVVFGEPNFGIFFMAGRGKWYMSNGGKKSPKILEKIPQILQFSPTISEHPSRVFQRICHHHSSCWRDHHQISKNDSLMKYSS